MLKKLFLYHDLSIILYRLKSPTALKLNFDDSWGNILIYIYIELERLSNMLIGVCTCHAWFYKDFGLILIKNCIEAQYQSVLLQS